MDLKFEIRNENLLIRDVFEIHQYSLPVIIQVTQGHHGDIDMDTFSIGHVMRIHTHSKQKRVVAKDNMGRHLSIPYNYPIKFRVSKGTKKAGKEQVLKDIINQNTLPIKVELCLPPPGYSLHVGHSMKQIETFGVLRLLETYDETYLLGNTIMDGTLDEEVIYIPIYLHNLVVATVSGIEGKQEREFTHLQRQLSDMADIDITYERTGGNNDIAVYSPDSVSQSTENIYDYIEPQHFIKYRPTNIRRKMSVPLPNIQELKSHFAQHNESASATGNIYTPIANSLVPEPDFQKSIPPPIPPKHNIRRLSGSTASASKNIYANEISRAVVRPQVPEQKSVQEIVGSVQVQGDTAEFVKGFTINDITTRLHTLNLAKYADAFKDAQLSGNLLLELNEKNLKEDFEMKGYEAIKLMKYARHGYVPE